jgi:uncharacterized metal-binding protein YceD (DUF177 family)
MVELNLDRLPAGRSELELADDLTREDRVVHGHDVPGFTARVNGALAVDNMDQKVLVHGRFEVVRRMLCDRSGEPFDASYPAEVEILILRNPGRGGEEMAQEDGWVIRQQGGVVALDEALIEAVVLDEPLKVVSPDHEGDERIVLEDDEEEMDPRWEALRQLRESTNEDQSE